MSEIESGWLIELRGSTPSWAIVNPRDYDEHWTEDSTRALRFARREDAQAYIDHIGWTEAFPSAHIWDNGKSALNPASGAVASGGVEADYERVIVGLNKQLTEQFDLTTKLAARLDALSVSTPPEAVASGVVEAGVVCATVRDGGEDWHIECRFADGQKFAAITVDREREALADAIAAWLNAAAIRARGQ